MCCSVNLQGRVEIVAAPEAGKPLVAALKSQQVEATLISADDLVKSLRPFDPADVLVLPDAGTCRVDIAQAVTARLEKRGKVLFLSEAPFQTLLYPLNGKWVGRDEFLNGTIHSTPVVRASAETAQKLVTMSDEMEIQSPVSVRTEKAPIWECARPVMHIEIPHLKGWRILSTTPTAEIPRDAIMSFWARGTSETTALAVEWKEKDESRWIATVPLEENWHFYALQPKDFPFWYDSQSLRRGGHGDRVHPDNAEAITFGLAMTHTKVSAGPHSFEIGDIGVSAPVAGDQLKEAEIKPIDCIYPRDMLYWMRPASAEIAEPYRTTDMFKLPELPKQAWSCYWRPMGSGFEKRRPSRFIPIVTAKNSDGLRAGTLAALVLSFKEPYKNAVYGYVSVPLELLRTNPWSAIMAKMLQRMQAGIFIAEAGSTEFTYDIRDLQESGIPLGIREFISSPVASISLVQNIAIRRADTDELIVQNNQEGSLTSAAPAAPVWRTAVSVPKDQNIPYRFRAQIRINGELADVVEQEIGFDGPRSDQKFVSAKDRMFVREGKPFRAFGVNYMPSSGMARLVGEEFEYWIEDASYDPEIVEQDLARIEKMGFNMISAFVYRQASTVPGKANVLDLLRRARKHNLLVNMSLRPNWNPFPAPDDVLENLIAKFRMAEKDEIMAYDIAWEPWWGEYKRRIEHGATWRNWVEKKYGSEAAAEQAWGFKPTPPPGVKPEAALEHFPSDDQLRKDDVWTTAVADYRAFVDEYLGSRYSRARDTIRKLDPNHLVSFRESEGGNPLVDPGMYPLELRSVADAVDFFSPEGYGIGDTTESARTLLFTNSYAQGLAPGKPVICAEYGYSVNAGSALDLRPEHLQREAQIYENVLGAAMAARSAGAVCWWFPGGFRRGENSDFGVVNPDGTERSVGEVIRKYSRLFAESPKPVNWTPEIQERRAESVTGYVGMFKRCKDRFFGAVTPDSIPLVVDPDRRR